MVIILLQVVSFLFKLKGLNHSFQLAVNIFVIGLMILTVRDICDRSGSFMIHTVIDICDLFAHFESFSSHHYFTSMHSLSCEK